MALKNTEGGKGEAVGTQVAPNSTGTSRGKQTGASKEVYAKGTEVLASLSEDQRAALGSKSGTLHFVHLLGLASRKATRRVSQNENKECSTPVGITLYSDEAIEVPVISVLKDKNTGIDASADIETRKVKAGEQFNVSYYEFMYLILRDEYAGFLEANGDAHGAYFSPKLPAFWSGSAKLPTPTVNFRQGSVKASMIDIDEKTPDGWKIKEDYVEKFGPLLKKNRPQRASGAKSSTPQPTVVAMALQEILGIKKAQ